MPMNRSGVHGFRPLILCYHAASASWPHDLSLGPDRIERQVRSLLRRFKPATAAEVARRPGSRLLAVTFDDAFRSVLDVAPRLERLGVPLTVFACSGFADDGRPLAIAELAGQAAAYPEELRTMDWDTLRALAERGVEIGSHTVSHPHLPTLSDREIRRELLESRERIEAELGRPCPLLAYPYGEEDDRCRAAARAAGYEAAFVLTRFGVPARLPGLDRYACPRVGMFRGDGLLRTALKSSRLVWRWAGAARRVSPAVD